MKGLYVFDLYLLIQKTHSYIIICNNKHREYYEFIFAFKKAKFQFEGFYLTFYLIYKILGNRNF